RDAEKKAIVPGETDGAVKCARADVDRDRANYTDCVKSGESSEVCDEKQNDRRQAERNEQRINRDAVTVQYSELPRHLAIARHHVEQPDHCHDGGVGGAEEQKEEDDSNDPAKEIADRWRSEEHTSELQSLAYLVCRLLLE